MLATKMISTFCTLSLLTTTAYAQTTSPCEGNTTENVIENSKQCSLQKLNRSYQETTSLLSKTTRSEKNVLQKIKEGINAEWSTIAISGAVLMGISIFAGSAALGTMAGMNEGGSGFKSRLLEGREMQLLKGSGIVFAVGLAAGIVGVTSENDDEVLIRVKTQDLPAFQDSLASVESNLKVRKATLETMIQIKQAIQ